MFSTKLNLIIAAMRPVQWTKNGLIFVALIFAGRLTDSDSLFTALIAFVIFSALSGSVYLINDIKDYQKDKKHPIKSLRPIASGRLSVGIAFPAALLIAMAAVAGSFYINTGFAVASITYIVLFVLYSYFLKYIPIVDIILIASGFVLRAVAGALAIEVEISSWLLLCTMLLALIIILGKRRHELTLLGDASSEHRDVLTSYTTTLLDQMISVVTAATLISYALYTVAPETIAKFGTENLKYSTLFVLYGIFRYLYIIYMKKEGGRPEKDILTDVPTLINFALWAVTVSAIIYK